MSRERPTGEEGEDALQYGDEAVNRGLDAILDDSAAAPYQKGAKKKRKPVNKCTEAAHGTTLVIVAGGWTYESKDDEILAIEKDSWKPTTADFMAMGAGAAPRSAKSPAEFFERIAAQPAGSIARVVYIGHGGFGLVFSGDAGGFGGGAQLSEDNLPDFQADIENKVRPKLHPNAKIDLITCYVGGNEKFMDALANATDRCVRGLTSALEVQNPVVTKEKQITQRGLSRLEGSGKQYRKGWKHVGLQIRATPYVRP